MKDTKPDLLKFPNKIKFWTYISELTDDLDFKNTIKLPNFWFYCKGEKFVTRSFKETLAELNKICFTKFDTKNSIATGSRVTLFINPRFEDIEIEDEVELVEEIVDVVEDDLISLDVESFSVEEDSSPDWDHVDTMYDDSDKKGSKDLLEDYARKWDIELPKNKSFENMVKEFKENL